MRITSYCRNELYHYGIKGQKWGIRRYQKTNGSLTSAGKTHYRSIGIRSAIARKQNEKIDASFKDWKENSQKRADAITLGKTANASKRAYENDKSNKSLKQQYKQDSKAYKQALKGNTTYRKGQIKKEVGSDLSRKYLSAAKKTKKQLDQDPTNRELQKQYNNLMSKHDIERAKARRAPEIAANRSRKKAAIKRTMTMTAKTAATTAAIAGGTYAVNKYLTSHDVRLNGNPVRVTGETVSNFNNAVKLGKTVLRYV